MPSPEQIKDVVARYFAATRSMDRDAWLATFADDAIAFDPVGAPATHGHAGLRQFWQNITAAFQKVGVQEHQVYVCGSTAAVKWSGAGVGHNGRYVSFEGIDVFEVNEDGKIVRMWDYWDPGALMARLAA